MERFEEVKQRVKEATDLVALIEGYAPLRSSGRNLVALCPFHEEKSPSFTVYPDSQHFKCYGCGKAGDAFSFLMEREGIGFRECLERLAQRAGVSTEGAFRRRDPASAPRPDAYAVLADVKGFFQQVLNQPVGRAARDYLVGRGLEPAIASFGLGAHPAAVGALTRVARERGWPRDVLLGAGLLNSSDYEPFVGRVMFPIEDERGRVVGFGGRVLDASKPKYLNSPESPVFRKRQVLYGLRHVKDAGVRSVVVMEGYTDVIASHLAGIRGAVATLGTAFTPDHAKLLTRWATQGVSLLFDGDRAGRAAAEKAYPEVARADLAVKIALLPDGMDPADMLAPLPGRSEADQQIRVARFTAVLQQAEEALAAWIRLKRARMDLTSGAQVAQVIDECGRILDTLEDPSRRQVLLSAMARQLGLDDHTMGRSLAQRARRAPAKPDATEPAPAAASDPLARAEVELLACVLAAPDLLETALVDSLTAVVARLLELTRRAVADGTGDRHLLLRRLFTECAEQPQLAVTLAAAADLAPRFKDPKATLETLLAHRQAFLSRQAAQQTRFELQAARSAGDQTRVDELTRQYVSLQRRSVAAREGSPLRSQALDRGSDPP